ncbi:DUF1850 domain-containing protein [Treponema sp.]|uniref:DUF1850 domain-containing protein n=1 Tax=Treponema sp. TaxID=166 RepID=UPI00388E35F0
MKTKAFLISVIFFLAVAFVFIIPLFPVLSISNRKNPSEKIYFIDGAQGFVVSYTHSVNKGRVHDYYRAEGKNLILYRTDFVSYGAGMPEIEETPGAVFYQADETYTMEYERKVGTSFLLSVGVIAEHSVTVANNEYFLKDFFTPKTSLVFECIKIPAIELLRRHHQIVR